MQSATSTAPVIDQALTSSEIEQANLHLDQTRNGLVGAIKGLSEAQWRFKPAPGTWSIAENVEHVASIQDLVLGLLQNQLATAPAAPADRNVPLIDALIINQFPNRLTKFPAPEMLHPKGDWELSQALDRVVTNTDKFAGCLQSIPHLRRHALDSPPLKAVTKGEHQVMDGYQWILAVSAHNERHTKQILEVKARPEFPAN